MRTSDQITVQGALSLVAVAAMLAYAAYALEIGPSQPMVAYTQQTSSQSAPAQSAPVVVQSRVYTGMVIKHRAGFVLRGYTGDVYHLADASQAEAFAGKSVKVTGKWDETAKLLHVEKIEEIPA